MATDNRISTLPEASALYSDIDLLDPIPPSSSNADADALFLVTKSGVKNEKITFKNLKSSILGNTVALTGNQVISGEKTFADVCTFEDTVYLNEVIDTTLTGDISGYSFIGNSGRFEKLGVGSGFADKSREPQYALHVEGDVCIEGQLNALGEIEFQGNLGLNDTVISGDLYVDGSGVFGSGLNVTGNSNIVGSLDVSGSGSFGGDLDVAGDISIGEKILHVDDDDTYIQFAPDQISLSATGSNITINDSEISFSISGEKKVFVDEFGRFAVNTDTPLGELSVSGDAYVEKLYVTGQNGGWEQIVPKGYDETIHFETNLISGQDTYEIDFPKTFGSIPTVHATLNNEGGGDVLFFNIWNIQEDSYRITFNQDVPNNNYSILTKAVATGDYSLHATTTQAFKTTIEPGQSSYTINYPNTFLNNPTVSVNIERTASYSPDDPGTAGDTFVYDAEFYVATANNTWRRVTMATVTRTSGTAGDTDFDDDFYYVCFGGTSWGRIPLVTSSKSDAGSLGDFDYDGDYMYVLTSSGWKQAPLSTWTAASSESELVPYMVSSVADDSFVINFASAIEGRYFVHTIASR